MLWILLHNSPIERAAEAALFVFRSASLHFNIEGEITPRGIGRGAQRLHLLRGPDGRAAVGASALEGRKIPIVIDVGHAICWYWLPRRETITIRGIAHLAPDPDGEHAGRGNVPAGNTIRV